MKNYDETISSVFDRISEYEVKKRKRKIVTRAVTSLCCFCLVALFGIGVWQSDIFNTTQLLFQMEMTQICKEQIKPMEQNLTIMNRQVSYWIIPLFGELPAGMLRMRDTSNGTAKRLQSLYMMFCPTKKQEQFNCYQRRF